MSNENDLYIFEDMCLEDIKEDVRESIRGGMLLTDLLREFKWNIDRELIIELFLEELNRNA